MDGSQSVRINFGSPVALFPLDAVLLPQQPMPLHIFEPRYRQMVDNELDGAGQIAIATVDREAPEDASVVPRIRPVVCIGQIVSHERLPDGRFHIVLHGLCRARVTEELPMTDGTLYRRVMTEPFGDEGAELPEPTDTMRRLRSWVDDALEEGPLARLRIAEQVLEYVRNDAIPTPVLLDVVGFTMVSGREPRYQMLSEPNPDVRTRLLHNELARLAKTIRAAEFQHPEAWPRGLSWN
ncbi:MAG: LON peptidase substrate-binding domain-containing protein [Planctomycetota bacterium]